MTLIPVSYLPYLLFLVIITATVGGFAAYQFSRLYMKNITPRVSLGIFGGRGAVGIIIASITLSNGFIGSKDYSVAIFATIIMAMTFTFIFERSLRKMSHSSPVMTDE